MAIARNPYNAGNAGAFGRYAVVTPSDTTYFANGVARGIYVGVSGDVTVVGCDDAAVLFKALPVGFHPIICQRVNATGTTATNINALFD